ncbi:MAG TPA: diguanylate cyclase [Candidatus Limnocylindrales bacterium]|nr:diguanylate cyclase [Candidatus Limnocylindrales bacterium]
MTKSAHLAGASRTRRREQVGTLRLRRRLRSDPHVFLALALVVPTVLVDLLDQGPFELALLLFAIGYLAAQVGLTALGLRLGMPAAGYSVQRLSRHGVPGFDRWSLMRLLLAVGFVAVAAYATADSQSVPLAPLYIPVIAIAAAIGAGEGLVVLVAIAFARLALLVSGPAQPAAATEQGLVLGVVGVILAVGTRRTVSSLGIALERLRTVNASERERNRQIAGLDAVGRTLAAKGPEPAGLQAVMDLLTGPFGYSHGSIYLGEELGGSSTELRMGAQHGYPDPIPTFDGSRGVIGRVIRTGQAALVPDISLDPDYLDAGSEMRSEICVPLVASGELLGIVNVESDRVTLDEHDLEIIRLVADRLAAALALSRERRQLAERAQLLQRVVNFGAVVTSTLDAAMLRDAIVAGLTEVVGADAALLTLLDHQDGTYRIRALAGGRPEFLGAEIRPGEGTAGRAIRDRAPVLDAAFDRRRFPASLSTAISPDVVASVAVPLIRDQVVIGAITLVRRDASDPFTELELEAVQIVGAKVALAITNADLHAEVMEASIRDSLTGTFNRRHFEPSLERIIAARKRQPFEERQPLAAIMFDLDEFGAFNKLHGHQTGDAVLRAFGKLLLERFRSSDLVARYGGEEFVAILEGTTRDDAFRIAEEVRTAFARQSVRGASGQRFAATVSAGCAELGPTDGLAELLGACDVGLAMAKGGGRNQVVAA